MKPFYNFCRSVFKLYFIVFHRHKTFGTEHIPQGRAIIAPNHLSFLDPPLIGASCPEEVHFLAKDTLFDVPLLGTIIRKLNAFPVSGNVGDLNTLKALNQLLRSNEKVIIFPEGVRSENGQLMDIKPGIALLSLRADAPIVPTFIQGTFEIWPRHRWLPKPWGSTFCVFGPPIYPDQFRNLSKKEAQKAVAQEVKKSIEDLRDRHLSSL